MQEWLALSPALWHHYLLLITFALCPLIFAALMLMPAAYGRHKAGSSRLWGPGIPTRWSWIIMEAPSSIGFALVFFWGDRALQPAALVLFLLWQSHYFQRTFIFPFRLRIKPGDTTPVGIPLASLATKSVISFLNASILSWSSIRADYGTDWLWDPRFLAGVAVFALGWHVNRKADAMLAALRQPGEKGYKIPRGWLYERISCPNYLGEILIWCGWAIASWSWAGLAFMLVTVANLLPRALQNHRWYHATFVHYPAERKALIPYLL